MKDILLVPQHLPAGGAVWIGKIALIDANTAEYWAFLLSRIGHPEYIWTSALRVLSNARAP